ncbi:MAG: hypothetical protein V4691_07380 [Pseudomonadota bacterium]
MPKDNSIDNLVTSVIRKGSGAQAMLHSKFMQAMQDKRKELGSSQFFDSTENASMDAVRKDAFEEELKLTQALAGDDGIVTKKEFMKIYDRNFSALKNRGEVSNELSKLKDKIKDLPDNTQVIKIMIDDLGDTQIRYQFLDKKKSS